MLYIIISLAVIDSLIIFFYVRPKKTKTFPEKSTEEVDELFKECGDSFAAGLVRIHHNGN